MKPNASLAQLKSGLTDFWQARNPRERRILVIALGLILLALIYSLLLDPALSGRTRLAKELPQLRQQVAQMQAMAREAASLPAAPGTASEPLSKESLEAGMAHKGLKPQNLTLSGDIVRVQLSAAPFPAILEWLEEIQKSSQLGVLEANIVAQAQAGVVDATLTLRQQKGE